MFKMFFIVLLIVAFTPLKEAQAEFVDVVAKVKPSVVGIGIHTPTSRPQNILRGTGFVIGDGHYVVTNAHVLPTELDESLLQKMAVFIGSGKKAKVRQAEIVVTSELYDLAILKLSGSALPALTLADEKFRGDGTYVAFTGFPIGTVLGLYPVTHRGIIASTTPTVVPAQAAEQINLKMLKRMRNPYLAYQLDATAYPGNSGSAMYDMKTGEVLGVINKVFVQATKEAVISNPSGITYAIPVKYLHQILRENNIKL
ncbi:serine protease [Colwellia sp. 4_MG-2023]|uniref:S1 family peptidase n=2 Tax=unclassified Colwellia TaxID=196834 RepID=UPI0026E39B3C|nr:MULTISPECIES: serine protease [unclassified Colwellia]MDO6487685.1 serine protease [Colwellia sp. 6_MG-2023]MDO6555810.1 serine protease [Colwellia sp. 4_MG-2023]